MSLTKVTYSMIDNGPLNARDFGAVGDGVVNDTQAFTNAIAACSATSPITPLYVPPGTYLIKSTLILPNEFELICANTATFFYDDTASPGSYCFLNGVDNVRGGSLRVQNLRITLKTVTACGIDLLNSIDSVFENTYIEGHIPANYLTNPLVIMSARNNVGIRLRNVGAENFWNVFRRLWINHCHTGVQFPAGNTVTQNFFHDVTMFGDAIYGDQTSTAFIFRNGQTSVIQNAYIESYYANTIAGDPTSIGGAIQLTGSGANNIFGQNITFDYSNDVLDIYGVGLNNPIPMNAFRLTDLTGTYPSDNDFRNLYFASNNPSRVGVTDTSRAQDGNYIESNPTRGGTPFTVTLTCGTSGTITLTSGAGGNQLYCQKIGRKINIWGQLNVDSVNLPVGRLFINGLPYSIEVDSIEANSSFAVTGSGLDATATTSLMGLLIQGTQTVEIARYVDGSLTTDTASKIKAGTFLSVNLTYTRRLT